MIKKKVEKVFDLQYLSNILCLRFGKRKLSWKCAALHIGFSCRIQQPSDQRQWFCNKNEQDSFDFLFPFHIHQVKYKSKFIYWSWFIRNFLSCLFKEVKSQKHIFIINRYTVRRKRSFFFAFFLISWWSRKNWKVFPTFVCAFNRRSALSRRPLKLLSLFKLPKLTRTLIFLLQSMTLLPL